MGKHSILSLSRSDSPRVTGRPNKWGQIVQRFREFIEIFFGVPANLETSKPGSCRDVPRRAEPESVNSENRLAALCQATLRLG